jgi:hypothetical protein
VIFRATLVGGLTYTTRSAEATKRAELIFGKAKGQGNGTAVMDIDLVIMLLPVGVSAVGIEIDCTITWSPQRWRPMLASPALLSLCTWRQNCWHMSNFIND